MIWLLLHLNLRISFYSVGMRKFFFQVLVRKHKEVEFSSSVEANRKFGEESLGRESGFSVVLARWIFFKRVQASSTFVRKLGTCSLFHHCRPPLHIPPTSQSWFLLHPLSTSLSLHLPLLPPRPFNHNAQLLAWSSSRDSHATIKIHELSIFITYSDHHYF